MQLTVHAFKLKQMSDRVTDFIGVRMIVHTPKKSGSLSEKCFSLNACIVRCIH